MSATFQLDGLEFIALNGGPQFTFSPAVSFFVTCETQEEVDELWEKVGAGGEGQRCGWKYGLSWQIVPAALGEMLREGCGKIAPGHKGNAEHGQARRQLAEASLRGRIMSDGCRLTGPSIVLGADRPEGDDQ